MPVGWAAPQIFAPGGKNPHAATAYFKILMGDDNIRCSGGSSDKKKLAVLCSQALAVL